MPGSLAPAPPFPGAPRPPTLAPSGRTGMGFKDDFTEIVSVGIPTYGCVKTGCHADVGPKKPVFTPA